MTDMQEKIIELIDKLSVICKEQKTCHECPLHDGYCTFDECQSAADYFKFLQEKGKVP